MTAAIVATTAAVEMVEPACFANRDRFAELVKAWWTREE
jgi:hypothetical protein